MNTLLLKHVGALKNYGTLKSFTHKCIYKNHTCGDKVIIYLKINKEIIKKISYKTESCLICQASCSIFSDCIKNKNLNTAINFTKLFINFLLICLFSSCLFAIVYICEIIMRILPCLIQCPCFLKVFIT
jgi:NifU-like protein involved in Fe-S cluster formation